MEREALPPPVLTVDLRPAPCATLLSYAGPYQLTLDSTVADLGIELHSYYLGQRLAGFIATSHLAVVSGQPPRVFCAPADSGEEAVGERRRDCLIHHLDQLSVLVSASTGGVVAVDVPEAALERMDVTASGPINPA